ncbi:hypothetical protein HK104_008635 [Borealophlyctis nickersoniae]|nr:hypothetical protein HK104_008635 [Borealophlyctis nickersoniae]
MPKSAKNKLKQALKAHVVAQAKAQKAASRLQPSSKSGGVVKNPKKAASQIRKGWQIPYSESDSILLVGEGNFSFAHALAEKLHGAWESLVATAYDSEMVAREKYPDLSEHVDAIHELGGEVLFRVDATDLDGCKKLRNRRFTKIVFNFPHVGAGIKDQDRNIRINQELIRGFFASAIPKLTFKSDHDGAEDGEIHITLKEGEPYDSWNVRAQAKATDILVCARSARFDPSLYEGYAHRRTIGFSEGLSAQDNEEILRKACRTYVFVQKTVDRGPSSLAEALLEEQKSKKRREEGTDSDSDGD